jgi:hypothetical protein
MHEVVRVFAQIVLCTAKRPKLKKGVRWMDEHPTAATDASSSRQVYRMPVQTTVQKPEAEGHGGSLELYFSDS